MIWVLHQTVLMKKELSPKITPSVYQSVYIPTLTYGHKVWVMTKKLRWWIQTAEMSFLQRVSGLSYMYLIHVSDRVRRSQEGQEFTPPFSGDPGTSDREETPRTHWRDYISLLVWEHLGIPRRNGYM